jgi:hypothetical protein
VSFLLSSRSVWLKRFVVVAVACFVPGPFQYAQASEAHEANIQRERQSQSGTSMEVRTWEQEAFLRARHIRLAQRRSKLENVNQGLIADLGSGADSFAAQQLLLDSARGQPGLTGLHPLPVSLFVP